MDTTNQSDYSKEALAKLLDVMEVMRNSKRACSWTKAQSWDSLVRHTIEEAYEVADAVERGDANALKAELADLLNQTIFYAQIAKEQDKFDFYDVIETLTEKLIRRHPNVFGDQVENDIVELEKKWEIIKAQERQAKSDKNMSVLDDVAQNLPALSVANKLQVRASRVGFDWPSKKEVFIQLKSEIKELEDIIDQNDTQEMLAEIGDIMFCCVNLIRHLRADPEQVMRKANHKFERRFRYIESSIRDEGKLLENSTVDELEKLWHKAKESE